MLIGLTIGCNKCNSNINFDNNSLHVIIYNTWYDFIYKFKDLRLCNNMNIMIMCMI